MDLPFLSCITPPGPRPGPKPVANPGPHHDKLVSILANLHVIASDTTFDSIIRWTNDGSSLVVNRIGFDRLASFELFTAMIRRYGFRTARTIREIIGGIEYDFIVYSHPLFTREETYIFEMIQRTDRKKATIISKINDKRSILGDTDNAVPAYAMSQVVRSAGANDVVVGGLGLVPPSFSFEEYMNDDANHRERTVLALVASCF